MSFSGFLACNISNNTIKINFPGNALFNTQSCLINKSSLRHLKQFLKSLSLLKDLSADATVAGIVNNILKLTQTFGNISQSV
jgi:hypothetical protein